MLDYYYWPSGDTEDLASNDMKYIEVGHLNASSYFFRSHEHFYALLKSLQLCFFLLVTLHIAKFFLFYFIFFYYFAKHNELEAE